MKQLDVSAMIVMYNLVVGILMMLASNQIGSFASVMGPAVGRYTKLSVFTLGSCITAVSGTIYLVFHLLRVGVE